jgi:hypothetical protein
MTPILLLLGLRPDLPPAEALHAFPGPAVTQLQEARSGEHLARLRVLRGLADRKEPWDRALAETTSRRDYWRALRACHDEFHEPSRRANLAALRDRVGPERFRRGWRPALLPEIPPLCPPPPELPAPHGANAY